MNREFDVRMVLKKDETDGLYKLYVKGEHDWVDNGREVDYFYPKWQAIVRPHIALMEAEARRHGMSRLPEIR